MKKETLRMLLDTAKGLLQPDCVIKNGRIINVFTNTIEAVSYTHLTLPTNYSV